MENEDEDEAHVADTVVPQADISEAEAEVESVGSVTEAESTAGSAAEAAAVEVEEVVEAACPGREPAGAKDVAHEIRVPRLSAAKDVRCDEGLGWSRG